MNIRYPIYEGVYRILTLEDVEADYVVNNDNQLYGVVAAIHLSELYKVLNCRNAFL